MPTWLGYDVLELEPNRPGPIVDGISRDREVLDSQTGERWVDVLEAAAPHDKPFVWPCHGRAEALAQRAWLDTRKGLVVPVWVPTWESDLTLAGDALSGATELSIVRIQYAGLLWAASYARRHMAVYATGAAPSYHYVTAAVDPGSGETETLTITPGLATACPAATTRISFLRFCRLAEQFVERTWSGGSYCQSEIPLVEIPKEAPPWGD